MTDKFSRIINVGDDAFEPPFAALTSDVNRYVLDNGLVILTKEVYPSRVAFLSLWARVGSTYETDEQTGISHFVEHMLFKNTKKRKIGQVAQEIHALGGYLNGFTSFDCTAYWMIIPGSAFPKALEIQYDAAFNPVFEPAEVEKERNVILEEIKMYKDRPADYLSEKVMQEAMQKHRYGRPVIGYEDMLQSIKAEHLQDYYRNFYKPNNCFIVAVGDIDTMDFVRKCERTFRKLREGTVQKSPVPREPLQRKMRRVEMEGDIMSAYMTFAFHIPSIVEKDIYSVSLLSTILGEGKSSRLYKELREKRKLVNEIYTYAYIQRDPCLLFIDVELIPENIEKTEQAVFEIISDITENGISDRELQRAKNIAEVQYIYRQEKVESQGRKIGYGEVMGDYNMPEKFLQRELLVSKDDMVEAAKNYLASRNCTVGIYRPAGT
jgi:zinc protease